MSWIRELARRLFATRSTPHESPKTESGTDAELHSEMAEAAQPSASAAVRLSSSSQGPPLPARPKGRATRRLHLGVDFGTCWSKLVLRDYESQQPKCLVVRPSESFKSDGGFRVPSSVVVDGGHLYFAWAGQEIAGLPNATVYQSPKMHAAFGDMAQGVPWPALPAGIDPEDLCALVVAYLLEIGRWAAHQYTKRLPGAPEPRLSMTMGVPMSMLDSVHLSDKFLRIARVGFELYRSESGVISDGMTVDAARGALSRVKDLLSKAPAVQDRRDWIRSEAEAGLLWAFKSPDVGEGLYSCVDIGAGTTDVSFFRIASEFVGGHWQKGGMAFYSAESGPPGVDAIDAVLVADGGATVFGAIRGNEASLLRASGLGDSTEIRAIANGAFNVYQKAWREAYRREKGVSRWKDYRVFLMGGGSVLPCLRERLSDRVWEQLDRRTPSNPGVPEDLFDWDGKRRIWNDDATFLLVAYGLSYLAPDTPPADVPKDVPPFEPLKPRRMAVDQDEFYPK